MNPFWSALIEALTSTAFLAVVAFLLRGFFQQLLARDVEHYKTRLQAENDQAKMRLDHELQLARFEHQTRFSLLHQKRSEAIIELHGMLTDTFEWMKEVANPVQTVSDEVQAQRQKETTDKFNAMARYFLKHRPYFDDGTCEQMDAILGTMKMAFVKFQFGHQRIDRWDRGADLWYEAWTSLTEKVPPLLKELEEQFRQSLAPISEVE